MAQEPAWTQEVLLGCGQLCSLSHTGFGAHRDLSLCPAVPDHLSSPDNVLGAEL